MPDNAIHITGAKYLIDCSELLGIATVQLESMFIFASYKCTGNT